MFKSLSKESKFVWGVSLRLGGLLVPMIIIVATLLSQRIDALERRVASVETRQEAALDRIERELIKISTKTERIRRWTSKGNPRGQK